MVAPPLRFDKSDTNGSILELSIRAGFAVRSNPLRWERWRTRQSSWEKSDPASTVKLDYDPRKIRRPRIQISMGDSG